MTDVPGAAEGSRAFSFTRSRELRALIVFGAVLAIALASHELWRDELQSWMIARASRTPTALLRNLRYEGHPVLWYALLWPFARVFHSVTTLQVLEWFIATGTAALVLFKAPFTLARRVALIFSYFFLYEYGALTRSYGLGVLLTVATMVVITQPKPHWLVRALLLGLLANTSAFGACIAIAIAIGIAVRDRPWQNAADDRRDPVLAALIFLALAAYAYAQAQPAPGTAPFAGWNLSINVHLAGKVLSAPFSALVPIPKLQHSWWNTSIGDGHTRIAAVAGLLILIAVTWSIRHSKAALVTWIIGVVLVLGFLYTKLGTISNVRYIGHVFVLYVVAMWFLVTDANAGRRGYLLFDGVLTVQVAVAIMAVGLDLFMPFTNAAAAANWFRTHHAADAPIVGCPDFAASAVAGELDRPISYPQGDRMGTYILWDRKRLRVIAPLNRAVGRATHGQFGTWYLLTNRPVRSLARDLVFSRHDGVVDDEHYWVYRLNGRAPPALPSPCRTP
ncbi:MAG TPA: hypothetical protein VGI86_13190 [Acidimicrobiia bacterium]